MLFSRDWLGQYVELPGSTEELARRLTDAGFAVELIEEVAPPEGSEASGRPDESLDVDVTTNRVDAMNHIGLARELAVATGKPLRLPATASTAADPNGEAAKAFSVTIESNAEAVCARYVGRLIRGVTVGPSPPWLVRRLEAIGSRAINNVVDVTNYVLWECGQPLHAFDLETLSGSEIRVRMAAEGEKVTTLDGEERKLDSDMMVIADAEQPVAIAGVMGGLDSEVTETTKDVLLESAWFDPISVRRTSKRLGMHTDASHRFERGVDPELASWAAARAAALIAEIAGGTVADDPVEARFGKHDAGVVRLDLDRLDAFAGIPIAQDSAITWLEGLGCAVDAVGSGRIYDVTIPSWRHHDLLEAADLYEEVLRIHGFDGIPATLPSLRGKDGPRTERQRLRDRLRRRLSAAGYTEAINYSFHSPEADRSFVPAIEGQPLGLENPLSELYSLLRRSVVPGLVEAARFNQRRGAGSVRLFELGVVFAKDADGVPQETETVALVAGGALGNPWQGQVEIDFFDLKGAVESLGDAMGLQLSVETLGDEEAEGSGLVAGAAGSIHIEGGDSIGVIGQLAGTVNDEKGFPLFVAELELDGLETEAAMRKVIVPSRIPGISVDLTFGHPLSVAWSEIRSAIDEAAPEILASVRLRDRYQGQGVAEGMVNTTIEFRYDAEDRQLTREEVNRHHLALGEELERRFSR